MDLSSYVDALGHQLGLAARFAGADAEALAERLSAPLESAARLVLQDAVSDAAQEISRELAPGSVDVRLRGRDLAFVVDRGPQDRPVAPAVPAVAEGPQDGDAGTARLTVRLPETLKAQLESAAEREGVSVNAYLVRTLTATVQSGHSGATEAPSGGNRLSGWVQ